MKRYAPVVPCGNPDTPIPENLLYTEEQLKAGMKPGNRPTIPAWHLVDGIIRLTYWHAIKYYSKVIIAAEVARLECTYEQAKEWVEGYHDFRNRRLEEVLKYLMDAYPPRIEGADRAYRQWAMVRNRTSECPQGPVEEPLGLEGIPRYIVPNDTQILKKQWLTDIMLGDPEHFWTYLLTVLAEFAECFDDLKGRMMHGGGNDVHRLEPISNAYKMMHNDLADFIAKRN